MSDWNEYAVIPDRPPSLDKKGFRRAIIPAPVKGNWRKFRDYFYYILICIFLLTPWLNYNGKQLLKLDLSTRQFTVLGQTFFAYNAPLIFIFFITFVFSIAYITYKYGRIWCGMACPQTVFIDKIFRKIDKFVEGNYLQRRKNDQAPLSFNKVLKRIMRWTLYIVFSSFIAHTFTAYFAGAKELLYITMESPAHNWSLFLWVQFLTAIFTFNFGWFREQFCLIACPYGRFQSVLMGKKTSTVVYDFKRGEPRKSKGVKTTEVGGDCINCLRCINVCPTGIDIRNGNQMECIGCTSCIDACDEIMQKVKKPKGLIRFSSEEEIESQNFKRISFLPIAFLLIIFTLILSGISYFTLNRPIAHIKVLRAIDTPYRVVQENVRDYILNHFKAHITAQSSSDIIIEKIELAGNYEIIAPYLPLKIKSSKDKWVHFFIKTEKRSIQENKKKLNINFNVVMKQNYLIYPKEVIFLSP